ncbi:MAG TPA: type II toxin-antitoxin system Phd/YefM family antitoxin [Geminicoccaceae bacterium]|nr:type II toxin-antitoxin system Phd/YefM family antitoxin [Geminicoccaceae bacterium]
MARATHRGGARDGAPAPAQHRGDTWQLKDAKARFSELFSRALERPQRVTRHGRQAVIMLAESEYQALRGGAKARRKTLAELFAEAPLEGIDLLRREDIDIMPRIDDVL